MILRRSGEQSDAHLRHKPGSSTAPSVGKPPAPGPKRLWLLILSAVLVAIWIGFLTMLALSP